MAASRSGTRTTDSTGPEQLLAPGPRLGVGQVEDRRAELAAARAAVAPAVERDAARPPRRPARSRPPGARAPGARRPGRRRSPRPGPAPTRSARAPSTMRASAASCSAVVPTSTATDPARHRWPGAAEGRAGDAARPSGPGPRPASRSWSSSRPRAPGRACRWRSRARRRTGRPSAEPTNETASTPSESRRALTASCAPWTRLTTPGGIASMLGDELHDPLGRERILLRGLQHDRRCRRRCANGMNQSGTIAGKLNGVIAATTPTGWLKLSTSIPRETPSSTSPFRRCGAAMAASTDSIPRPTSAKASGTRLAHVGRDQARELVLVGDAAPGAGPSGPGRGPGSASPPSPAARRGRPRRRARRRPRPRGARGRGPRRWRGCGRRAPRGSRGAPTLLRRSCSATAGRPGHRRMAASDLPSRGGDPPMMAARRSPGKRHIVILHRRDE